MLDLYQIILGQTGNIPLVIGTGQLGTFHQSLERARAQQCNAKPMKKGPCFSRAFYLGLVRMLGHRPHFGSPQPGGQPASASQELAADLPEAAKAAAQRCR